MDDPWNDLERAGDWLLGLEQAVAPHLIRLNTYVHGALPWRAPALMVGHSCVLSWWEAVKGEAAPPSWEPYRQAVRRGLRSASVVIALSRAMLNRLYSKYCHIPDGRVILNGLNPAAFKASEKSSYIFAAGRLWDKAKNIQALENVASRLAWPVCVAGDDQHPGGGRKPPVHLRPLGRLPADEMKRFMSRAAIYALPVRYEPFGLSVLEAALSGCALVLGGIEILREIWGDAALFVKPDNSEELFSVLSELILSEKLRLDLASRARHHGLSMNSQHMAAAYAEVYEELLQKRAM
jgi:glycogen synthase